MDEVKGRVLAAWCLAEQFGVFGGGRKCLHKVSSSLEEIHKGAVQVTKGLLKGDRRHIGEPGVVLLESGKHGSQVFVVQALPLLSIGRLASREAPIIDEAAASKRLSKDDFLLSGQIESILVGSLRLFAHGLLALSLFLDVQSQGSQNLAIERAIILFGDRSYLLQ